MPSCRACLRIISTQGRLCLPQLRGALLAVRRSNLLRVYHAHVGTDLRTSAGFTCRSSRFSGPSLVPARHPHSARPQRWQRSAGRAPLRPFCLPPVGAPGLPARLPSGGTRLCPSGSHPAPERSSYRPALCWRLLAFPAKPHPRPGSRQHKPASRCSH